METTKKSSNILNWLIFLLSFVVMILMLMYVSEFFWVALPFVLTFLVKAVNGM